MTFFRKLRGQEEETEDASRDLQELREALERARLPEAVGGVAAKELERIRRTDSSTPEYTIGVNYLEFLLALPWNRFTEDNLDLGRGERILEAQHYGLRHVKERILEYLAVRALCSLRDFHILVVDDEALMREYVEEALIRAGQILEAMKEELDRWSDSPNPEEYPAEVPASREERPQGEPTAIR